jgi:hypothetical protein
LAGVASETYPVEPFDLDGKMRPTVGGRVTMGAYELINAPVFQLLPGLQQVINLEEGQIVTSNPYTIRVRPTDDVGINRVEFYVDGVLIGSVNTAVDGVYSCLWDTAKYQSQVRVVAYNDYGITAELTRTATVSLPYVGR